MEGRIKAYTSNGTTTISFFHPQSNSLPGNLLRQLAEEISKAGKDENTKVIVLQSEGDKAFCAGASFDELISIKDFETGKNFFSGFAMVINAIRKAPKFVIARVQGKAVGGGVGIACAADYALSLDSASVKLSELAIGIGPFVVGPAVERKIGNSAFTSLSINATEWQTAQWAKEKGLYVEIYKSAEEMDKAISILTDKLSKSNQEAMQILKKVLWQGTENWDTLLIERAELSGKLVLSEFTINAINKFKAKHNMPNRATSTLNRLLNVGIGEGISFLILLFIAMPLKYVWDMPTPVRVTGMLHGVLFIWYAIALLQAKMENRWTIKKAGIAFLLSFLPFGTFFLKRVL